MRKALIGAVAALALAACSQQAEAPAEEAGPPTPVATEAPAGTYAIEPHHASVVVKLSHLGLSNYTARFNSVDGALTIDPADPTSAQIFATVDPASLDTYFRGDYRGTHPGSPYSSFEQAITRGAEWLNVGSFPQATFASTSITLTGENTADVVGDLTIRGVTHPITLHATFNHGYAAHPFVPDGPAMIGFSAEGVFKRSDYGMTMMVNPDGPGIGDDVTLQIEAEFVREDQAG